MVFPNTSIISWTFKFDKWASELRSDKSKNAINHIRAHLHLPQRKKSFKRQRIITKLENFDNLINIQYHYKLFYTYNTYWHKKWLVSACVVHTVEMWPRTDWDPPIFSNLTFCEKFPILLKNPKHLKVFSLPYSISNFISNSLLSL